MAKFTVYFKDKAIQSNIFESGVVHIGRDDSNDLVVDSLAVAPVHAVAVIKDGKCVIKQMNEKFPLLVNNRPIHDCSLQNNDVINIGKHYVVYNTIEAVLDNRHVSDNPDVQALNEKIVDNVKLPEANLQIMDGEHIGRILPLKKAMTRLGHESGGVIVIARRKEGYFLSALQEHAELLINNQPLGNRSVKLSNNDIVTVGKISMQFFQD